MDSSLAKKNTTRFLIYSFVGLLVFSMGVFAMLGVYMSRKSTKTIHEVGEIYMSGMPRAARFLYKGFQPPAAAA